MLPHVWDLMDQSGKDFFFSFSMCSVHLTLKPGGKIDSTAVSRESWLLLGEMPLSKCVYSGGDAKSSFPLCREVQLGLLICPALFKDLL